MSKENIKQLIYKKGANFLILILVFAVTILGINYSKKSAELERLEKFYEYMDARAIDNSVRFLHNELHNVIKLYESDSLTPSLVDAHYNTLANYSLFCVGSTRPSSEFRRVFRFWGYHPWDTSEINSTTITIYKNVYEILTSKIITTAEVGPPDDDEYWAKVYASYHEEEFLLEISEQLEIWFGESIADKTM